MDPGHRGWAPPPQQQPGNVHGPGAEQGQSRPAGSFGYVFLCPVIAQTLPTRLPCEIDLQSS